MSRRIAAADNSDPLVGMPAYLRAEPGGYWPDDFNRGFERFHAWKAERDAWLKSHGLTWKEWHDNKPLAVDRIQTAQTEGNNGHHER